MAFEGFEHKRVATGGCEVNLVVGGAGPPLLLLHGYPQTHFMWHKVAPSLAERLTVVASDLRGYGDSGHPAGDGEAHAGYCKRATANDQVEAMAALGFARFMVAGHDRGARVAHRMALDHPLRVEALSVLDIVPTRRVFADVAKDLATAYYHWFFLIQPAPFPETMIGHDPEYYLRWVLGRWGTKKGAITDEAFAEYLRCFSRPETIHASCEDYRAAASIDLAHDEADGGQKIDCPVQALWGERAVMHRMYDVVAVWRDYADDVQGQPVACGHFLPEEAPAETARLLAAFFAP